MGFIIQKIWSNKRLLTYNKNVNNPLPRGSCVCGERAKMRDFFQELNEFELESFAFRLIFFRNIESLFFLSVMS